MTMRSSDSPSALSEREWRSTQPLQPLIWPARSLISSCVVSGTPACLVALSSFCSACIAPGAV